METIHKKSGLKRGTAREAGRPFLLGDVSAEGTDAAGCIISDTLLNSYRGVTF